MSSPLWTILPCLNNWAMTEQACLDVLGQSIPTKLLIVAQAVDDAMRENLERLSERNSDRVLCWFWDPRMPSLSGVWNRALDFVWASGGTEAWVVNNDLKLALGMADCLSRVLGHEGSYFVSGVGVREDQWPTVPPQDDPHIWSSAYHDGPVYAKGGPDFSCFLISKACHEKYRFDENFIPAHCEDLDTHRRMMLSGDGDKIFSINLPYLHYAAQTLKAMGPAEHERTNRQIESVCRAYYAKKWGGPVNQETFWTPFDSGSPDVNLPLEVVSAIDQPTTPALQEALRQYNAVQGSGTQTPVQ